MKMKVAIAGSGLAGRWHAQAAAHYGGDLVAFIDNDPTKTAIMIKSYPKASAYKALSEMLSDQKPDVIHVCTPTNTHIELAAEALNSGINVMLEKPMAQTADEVHKLYELAETQKLHLCPTHQFLFRDRGTKN